MNKMPVGATISGAYQFAFAGFLDVLAVVWLPVVVMAALAAGAFYLLAPDIVSRVLHGAFDMAFALEFWRVAGALLLLCLVTRSMITVGLQEKALGRAHDASFYYFKVGAPFWRMIGAKILLFIVLLLIGLLTAAAVAIVSFAAGKFLAHLGKLVAVVAIVAGAVWFIYVTVRLVFFLPAVVVAEERVDLGRSWEMSDGNFWRIVAAAFVVFAPVVLGFSLLENALVGALVVPPDFAAQFGPHPTIDQLDTGYKTIVRSVFQQMGRAWPVIALFEFLKLVVYSGLANGAVAKAYLGTQKSEAA